MQETTMFSDVGVRDRSQLPYDKYREEDRQPDGTLSTIGPIARGIANEAVGLVRDDDGSVSPEQVQNMAEYIKSELADLSQLGFTQDQINQIQDRITAHLRVTMPALSAPMSDSEELAKERGRQVTELSRSAVQRTAKRIAQIQESGQPDQLTALPSEQRLLNQQIALFLSTAQRYGTPLEEARQIMNLTVDEAGVRRINQPAGKVESTTSAAVNPDNSAQFGVSASTEPDIASSPEPDVVPIEPETEMDKLQAAMEKELANLFEQGLGDGLMQIKAEDVDGKVTFVRDEALQGLIDRVKAVTPPYENSSEFKALVDYLKPQITQSLEGYIVEQAELAELEQLKSRDQKTLSPAEVNRFSALALQISMGRIYKDRDLAQTAALRQRVMNTKLVRGFTPSVAQANKAPVPEIQQAERTVQFDNKQMLNALAYKVFNQ